MVRVVTLQIPPAVALMKKPIRSQLHLEAIEEPQGNQRVTTAGPPLILLAFRVACNADQFLSIANIAFQSRYTIAVGIKVEFQRLVKQVHGISSASHSVLGAKATMERASAPSSRP